ncbi:Uncharacterised protein [Mycobacterium tuberculosis]|uniref:Uncharacterized protein n=1 Tax=Mycobacterium tuberculosis TaxID=1773 RepID=A0A655AP79_MYCTX|nr:Uncharacterised protein [Mycobacterium tuberculosis]CKT47133.1 Uncharacterised protein [Mycobacterium tuberculosis]CKV16654.1 Uncharacterised protein [Mycobacterium tuberculosis]CNY98192.1 Uncharacterised protein [Mycobacterium tuberculosis]
MSSVTNFLIDPDPRLVNQPSGNRDSLLSSRKRNALAKRASITCSHSVRAAASKAPVPSNPTAANPTVNNRCAPAPETSSLDSSTNSTNGANCASVTRAASTPESTSGSFSGASSRLAA